MNKIEMEKTINSLKGVAGILLAISQAPEETIVWREWVYDLLYEEVRGSVEKLEELTGLDK